MASAEHKGFGSPDETRPFEKGKAVVGNEPVVVVDWWSASNYAKG